MKTNRLTLFILLFSFLSLKGQVKQNSDTTRIYKFSVSDYPQKVKLIEYRNKSYEGLVAIEFYNKPKYNTQ